jgi:hypothetical protein
MVKLSKWFKNAAKGTFIGNCSPELMQCEFECRARECSHGKWLTCENRIRCMNEEIAFSRTERVCAQPRALDSRGC